MYYSGTLHTGEPYVDVDDEHYSRLYIILSDRKYVEYFLPSHEFWNHMVKKEIGKDHFEIARWLETNAKGPWLLGNSWSAFVEEEDYVKFYLRYV